MPLSVSMSSEGGGVGLLEEGRGNKRGYKSKRNKYSRDSVSISLNSRHGKKQDVRKLNVVHQTCFLSLKLYRMVRFY